jgi:hypothetical protein
MSAGFAPRYLVPTSGLFDSFIPVNHEDFFFTSRLPFDTTASKHQLCLNIFVFF